MWEIVFLCGYQSEVDTPVSLVDQPSCGEVAPSLSLHGRIRRYRLQLLPLHDMDGSDDDSDEEDEEREGEDRETREPVFTVSKDSRCTSGQVVNKVCSQTPSRSHGKEVV